MGGSLQMLVACVCAAMVWMAEGAAGITRSGPPEPAAPVDVRAADIGGGRVMVSWEGEAGAGARVERQPARAEELLAAAGERSVIDACGAGTFSYRVQAVRDGDASAFSEWVTVVVSGPGAVDEGPALTPEAAEDGGEILRGVRIGAEGWAELRPSEDSRLVYISSTTGNDRNDGLSESTPKRTIAAGYRLLRSGYPDWLLLKSGDVWEEGELPWARSGRSPEERMVVGVYGGEARAIWRTGRESGIRGTARDGRACANLVFRDLHLVQHLNDGTGGGSGFMLMDGWRDVLIENCRVEGYRMNFVFQAFTSGVRQRNIAVRRSVIIDALGKTNAHAQGIYADGVDGLLIEENIFDRNGWGPDVPTANMFRHNTYIQTRAGSDRGCTNVVSRGNISARASASGLMQRPGGIVEGNLLLENPIGIVFGHRGGPEVSGRIAGNVILDSRDIRAGEPRGFGVWVSNAEGVTIEDNIVAHQRGGTENVVGINVDGMYRDLTVRRNIVYDWAIDRKFDGGRGGAALAWHGTASGEIRIEGNEFQQSRGGLLVGHYAPLDACFAYAGNTYFSANREADEFWRRMSFAQWCARSGEESANFEQRSYPDAQRTIATYMEDLGSSGGVEAFMGEARLQERARWREEFTAEAVIRYVREGFGHGEFQDP